MGDFFKNSNLSHCFYSSDAFCILTIGYNNFKYVKPILQFRTQGFYTWHFIISGSGFLEIAGKVYNLKGGDMFFIPPDTKMRYFPKEDDPWEYVWFAFKGEKSKSYGELVGFTEGIFTGKMKYFGRIKNLLENRLRRLEDGSVGYFGALSTFYETLEICTSYTSHTGIHRIKEQIDESFTITGFNIEKLCYDVGISHAHLLRLFKKEYGITVIRYVIKKRIELACELLQNSDLSVGEVCFSCGFSDEIHFIKTFKKEMGVSALNYRKKFG